MIGIRTFIAVDIPNEIRDKLKDIQKEFSRFDVKLVDPALIHITMKFLGDVQEKRISDITEALDQIEYKPFTSEIGGVGVFPKPDYIRVIWVGAAGDFEPLHRKVEDALKPLGFGKDRGRFTAHATIARVKKISPDDRAAIAGVVAQFSDCKLGSMTVDAVKLKKSTLTRSGPIYDDLYVKKF